MEVKLMVITVNIKMEIIFLIVAPNLRNFKRNYHE